MCRTGTPLLIRRRGFCDPTTSTMLEKLRLRCDASGTTRGDILSVQQFAEYFGKPLEEMGGEEIRRFQLFLIQEKQLLPRHGGDARVGPGPTKICARYSYRKATIGSTLVARREGM